MEEHSRSNPEETADGRGGVPRGEELARDEAYADEARAERLRAESRLAARTRELDLIQTLGRRAAEARTPDELFAATVSVLHQAEPLDLAMIAGAFRGKPELIAFLSRPFEERCVRRLALRAGEMLGWSGPRGAAVPLVERRIEEFDERLAPRAEYAEAELILLPVPRRNRPVACLLFLPSGAERQDRMRLLYSAANQLSLHLDRILSGREAEADRFRQILDSMPQAVVLADRALRIVQCNRSARGLLARLGAPGEGSLEETLRGLGLLRVVDRVRVEGEPVADGELSVGEETVLSVTASPLSRTAGDDLALVLVFTDVTDSRRMQQRLAQSEKMSSLGQLISGTAHELNNPLASVLGYAQLLRVSAEEGSATARRLEVLHREAERCRRIVRNLLAFARQRAPERRPISLNEVAEATLALLDYQLRVEGISVETALDPALPPVRGDAHQLQQALVNLLTNAKDAIREIAEAGRIRLRTAATPEGVLLEVRDSGPGVPAELQSRLFDPFYTTKAEGRGTGLGLSIVYGIVTAHDGSIEVVSGEGGGACFRIRLPVEPGRTAEEGPRGDDRLPEAEASPGRLLVVDDEPAVAEMIREALTQDGHRVEVATSGAEALGLLVAEEYDLVIADLRMPGTGAERLFEELRRRPGDPAARLLVTTGDTVSEEPERFAARAGLELLRKPFDVDQLRRRVRRRIAGRGTC